MKLNNCELGKLYTVTSVTAVGSLKYKFFNFGIVEGAKIVPFMKSPFGGIGSYRVGGTLVAIRDEDACGVEVAEV